MTVITHGWLTDVIEVRTLCIHRLRTVFPVTLNFISKEEQIGPRSKILPIEAGQNFKKNNLLRNGNIF